MTFNYLFEKKKIDISEFNPNKDYSQIQDYNTFQGRFIEDFVIQILKKCEVDLNLIIQNYNFEINKIGFNYLIKKEKKYFLEIDNIFEFNGELYFGEVKSWHLNGYSKKIAKIENFAKQISNNYKIILFSPQTNNKKEELHKLKEKTNNLILCNLNYNKKKLKKKLNQYYLIQK